MLRGPFLSDIDSRAAVKGSRDPLGQVSIWTRFGRHVVGNLSTVSTSVRDFTVLLIGLWLIERALEDDGAQHEVDIFLRWEQLAGYARALHAGGSFRGVEKVRANLQAGGRQWLSADRGYQILGNQKIYGIWGLYTVPATSSALASGSPLVLRPAARAFVESNYVSAFAKAGFRDANAIRRLVAAPKSALLPDSKDEKLVAAVGRILRPDRLSSAERAFYDTYLVRGGPDDDTGGLQQQLAELLEPTLSVPAYELTPRSVARLAAQAGQRSTADALGWRLERIRACEAVMAPAYRLFLFLLARDGKPLTAVADEVRATWGEGLPSIDTTDFRALLPELRQSVGDEAACARWVEIADTLAAGDYATAIRALVTHNAFTMKQRGAGAPWVDVERDRLRVRFRDDLAALPGRKELPSLWRFPYFLDSLRAVTRQVRGTA